MKFLGRQPDDVLRRQYTACKALIFPGEEDFGIVPLEVQACGRPVIAYGRGGALETVLGPESAAPTGLFFTTQTEAAIGEALRLFEQISGRMTPQNCRANAERFSQQTFDRNFMAIVDAEIARQGPQKFPIRAIKPASI